MKTFKQFLNESLPPAEDFLRAKCMPALLDIAETEKFFWRGSDSTISKPLFSVDGRDVVGRIITPRKDRLPKDTPVWAHELIDHFFHNKFGINLRSTATFTFNDRVSSTSFGAAGIVIPIGKYSTYWSPSVDDLTDSLFPDLSSQNAPGVAGGSEEWSSPPSRADEEEHIRFFLSQAGYKKTDPENALTSSAGSEIMLTCDSYIHIPLPQEIGTSDDIRDFTQREMLKLVKEIVGNNP